MATRAKDFPLPALLPIQFGNWKRAKELGAGAFGTVHMWQNVQTEEKIAIKKCKNQSGETMGRWQTEMKLIENMNHPNIVSYVVIPDELRAEYPKICSLGMEYCSEGDLRKFLGNSIHPCGLPEHHIIDVMGDIGSAIKYLHEKKNMHRDLKPENIVLKPRPGCEGRRYQFKITDLGYAKDLDTASCGHSFVGTLAYLAPEVAIGNNPPQSYLRYYTQVDYWSFGLVVFECITGHRPFLHNLSPIPALNEVKNKEDDVIYAWLDTSTGKPKTRFEKTIPQPHHINSFLTEHITRWLQLMLRINETKRGGERDEWFRLLQDEILGQKYAKVINVTDMQQMTFPLDETAYIQALHRKIQQERDVPMGDQLLLLKDGATPLPNKHIMEQIEFEPIKQVESESTKLKTNPKYRDGATPLPNKHNTGMEQVESESAKPKPKSRHPDNMVLFLFNKSIREDWPIYKCSVPPVLLNYLGSANSGHSHTDERALMNLGLDNTFANIKTGWQFHGALTALRIKIQNLSGNLRNCLKDFETKHLQLSGMLEMFNASLNKDVKENDKQDNVTQICSNEHFQNECILMRENFVEWSDELMKGQALIKDAGRQLSKTTGYFTEAQLDELAKFLREIKAKAIEMHHLFRCECRKQDKQRSQSPSVKVSEKRHREFRQMQLRTFMDDIWKKIRDRIEAELKPESKLRKMMRFFISHHMKLEKLFFDMTDKVYQYSSIRTKIIEQQEVRQHSIWNMLQYMKDVYHEASVYTKDRVALAGLEAQDVRLQSFIDDFLKDENLIEIMNFSPDTQPTETNTSHLAQHQNPPLVGVRVQAQPQQNLPTTVASNSHTATNGIGLDVGSRKIIPPDPAPLVLKQTKSPHMLSPQTSSNSHPTHPNGPLVNSVPSDNSSANAASNPVDPSLLRLSELRISKESNS